MRKSDEPKWAEGLSKPPAWRSDGTETVFDSPWMALTTMVEGALGSSYGWGFTLYYATNFIFTGLAVMVAYHAARHLGQAVIALRAHDQIDQRHHPALGPHAVQDVVEPAPVQALDVGAFAAVFGEPPIPFGHRPHRLDRCLGQCDRL